MFQRFIERRQTLFIRDATTFLERVLIFSFCIHGIAMLAMLFFLLPGVPGGPNGSAARMAYAASFPWLWRLGWFCWQLTALSDLLLSLALLRKRWRLAALFAVLATVVGIVPDQMGQVLWVTQGVGLAQQGSLAAYSQFEATVFFWVSVYGGAGYTLAALGWTWYFATQAMWRWPRALTIYSLLLWGLFAFISLDPLLPASLHLSPLWIAGGNALGFILLLLWLALVAEIVLRATRPEQMVGRYALWRHPNAILGRFYDLIGNSRFLRTLGEYVPSVPFISDITNVVYVNYLVEASKLEPSVPAGLELQRLGSDGRYALFTFLTYKHGHFGPRFLGKLRQLLPSPIQSNWRIYVRDPHTQRQGIFFVTNACTNTIVALGARFFAEGMPMHVFRAGSIGVDTTGDISLSLENGRGSAPDARATLARLNERPMDGPWDLCFANYKAMLAYCVPQDRAFSSQPWYGRITRQEIKLDIPLEACQALDGQVSSQAAASIVGDAVPFCFFVANVYFRFEQGIVAPLLKNTDAVTGSVLENRTLAL